MRAGTAYGLDSGPEVHWRYLGACAGEDPDWWTPNHPTDREAGFAARLCRRCPVMDRCDAWAQANRRLAEGAIYAGRYYSAGEVREVYVQPDAPSRVGWGQLPLDHIREMAAAGCTDRQIAMVVGSTEGSVRKTRQYNGIPAGREARRAA